MVKKYKVGNKLRVIGNHNNHKFKIGSIIEVVDTLPLQSSVYKCRNDRDWWFVNEKDLEEVTLEEETFTTEPIDYTGCHPDIAEALKKGSAILCRVKDYVECKRNPRPTLITAFIKNKTCNYITKNNISYRYAEPVINPPKPKTVTKVKKASDIVKWLEDNGYKVDKFGHWSLNDNITFTFSMFHHCGKEPDPFSVWLPQWLEEVEC